MSSGPNHRRQPIKRTRWEFASVAVPKTVLSAQIAVSVSLQSEVSIGRECAAKGSLNNGWGEHTQP